ncbi:MAG: pilus assembly protein TadG-related protein [Clostridia bacterium]|nr:pilus assembly protein TadG-related protein [Clostridia bacterium]
MKRKKGAVTVIFVFAFTLMMFFAAIVIDMGRVEIEKTKMQNAVDAATLAAALDLPDTVQATAAANHYVELNGYSSSNITVSFSSSNTIVSVKSTKNVNYTLARVIGLNSTDVVTGASAQTQTIGAAFDYALFSGSSSATLTLNGSGLSVSGSTHSNASFIANGSCLTITGACEAVKTITVNGSGINILNRYPNSASISMPDFSDTIKAEAQQAGTYYNGDKTFNGSSMCVDEPIYVNGNLTVNGSNFTGKGCILATGNITFNGSNLTASSNAVCFYSKTGSITVNGSGITLDGVLYAPAASPNGNILLNGSNQTINGRIVSNTVTINGSGLKVTSSSSDLACLPKGGTKLIS